MKPALTAEEWWEIKHRETSGAPPFDFFMAESGIHGKVAWMLHNQPFGFTRKHVELLRAVPCSDRVVYDHEIEQENKTQEAYADLADRIEALLPPDPG